MNSLILIFGIILLLIYLVGSFFIAYHLLRFGSGIETRILAFVFIAGIIVLTILLFISFSSVDINALLP
ncbi:MAG: hypothetical protein Q7R95_00105 [bacterium]|nr:hypothetical protein [bacterium]